MRPTTSPTRYSAWRGGSDGTSTNASAAGLSFARLRVLDTLTAGRNGCATSDALNVAPRTITGLVDALEEDGLVARSPTRPTVDVTVLTITPEGQRLLVTAGRERSDVIAGLFAKLSPDDCAELDRILRTLRDAVPDPRTDGRSRSAPIGTWRVNRLADETSPYLRQHADNPVDWYPWGDEAFARGPGRGQAAPAVGRLLVVPLVPRDGARVVRGPRDRGGHERAVRQREGRPRGTARRRRRLHAGRPGDDRARRLADDRVPRRPTAARSSAAPTSRTTTARACPGSSGCWTRSTRRGATGATTCSSRRASSHEAIAGSARRRCAPERGDAVRRDPRPRGRDRPRRSSTPRFGGFGRAPKFPQAMTLDLPARAASCADQPTRQTLEMVDGVARRDGRGRHLRPGRRRLPPLLRRRVLARPPLREDALRPGAARRAPTCTAGSSPGTPRYRRDRRGDDRVRAPRPARTPTAASSPPRTPTPKASRASSTCWSLEELEAICGDDAAEVVRYFGVTARRQLRRSAHRLPRQHPPRRRPRPRTGPRRSTRVLAGAARAPASTGPPGLDDKVLLGWNALFLPLARRGRARVRP